MTVNIYNAVDTVSTLEKKEIIDFLHEHLNGYHENWSAIQNAVEYALNPSPAFGGFIVFVKENQSVIGSLVMNKTRMKGYIPENQLVYLAVHPDHKEKGVEKSMLDTAVRIAKGNISLHLKPGDPYIELFENYGFNNKYLELRYNKN